MIGAATVIINYVIPEVFDYLLASSGAIALIMYLVIASTQLSTRDAMRTQGTDAHLESPMGLPLPHDHHDRQTSPESF